MPIGIRRGERELPARQAEAFGQQTGGDRRIRRRQHEGRSESETLGDRLHGRDRGVPDHRARVAEAEVDEVDAVDRREVRALGPVDEHGPRARPLRHPEHRHPVGQVHARLVPELLGARVRRPEPLGLLGPEGREPSPILVHGLSDQRCFASRRRRALLASCVATTMTIARMNTNDAMTFASGGMPRAAAM